MYEWINANIEVCACRLTCKHCYLGYTKKAEVPRFSYDHLVSIIRDLSDIAIGPNSLTRDGVTVAFFPETTLTPKAADLANLVEDCGMSWFESRRPMSTGGASLMQRDGVQEYLEFLTSRNNKRVQLTLHGLPEFHDEFTGRSGTHADCIQAAHDLIEAGFEIQWSLFVYKNNIEHVAKTRKLIRSSFSKDQRITVGIPCYIENAIDIDSHKVELRDLDRLEDIDRNALLGTVKTEADHVKRSLRGESLEFWWSLKHPEIIIGADSTVYRSNFAYEPIGSLTEKSLIEILKEYSKLTKREELMESTSHKQLASEFGDPESQKLYSSYGMWIKWICQLFIARGMSVPRRFT